MIANFCRVLVVCAIALALPTSAHAESELPSARKLAMAKKVCERAWHKQDKPRSSVTRLCAQYWLFAYNYSLRDARVTGVENALSLDPQVTGVEVTRFSRAQFLAMAKHARKLPLRTRRGDDWIAIRAREYFEGAAASKLSLSALNACSGTLECLLRPILTERKLKPEDLFGLDAMHMRILRHAVYARHGKRFESRELYKLFYTDAAASQSGGLLPRQPKRGFRDDALTDNDRANLTLIEERQKQLRKDFARLTPIFLREATR